jgi:predicted neuraminidase
MKFQFLTCLVLIGFTAFSQNRVPDLKLVKQRFIFNNPPFESCHASTITELANGKLIAAWFGGPHEGHEAVNIWISTLSEGEWSKPVIIADGIQQDGKRYACWNPVLFTARSGKLFLYYKVGPSPREWWGVMRSSEDNGVTWSKATLLPDGILGPIKNKPVQLHNGDIIHPSSTESLDEKQWLVHIERSDSNSENWQKISIDSDSFGVIQPTILVHPDNKLQLLCRSRQNAIVQTWSTDNGKSWSPLSKLHVLNPNSGIDAVTTKQGFHVLVYNPAPSGKEWFNGRNELRVAISTDGLNWKDVYQLERQQEGEFSYPAIIQTKDGMLHITYTHGRRNIKHVVLAFQTLPRRRN